MNLKITFAVNKIEVIYSYYNQIKHQFKPYFIAYISPDQQYISMVCTNTNQEEAVFKEAGILYTSENSPNQSEIRFDVYSGYYHIGSVALQILKLKRFVNDELILDIFQDSKIIGKIYLEIRVDGEFQKLLQHSGMFNDLMVFTENYIPYTEYYNNIIPIGYSTTIQKKREIEDKSILSMSYLHNKQKEAITK